MRVLQNINDTKHWLYYSKTGKIMHINATGARKVASLCEVEIENITTEELKILKKNIKKQ